jgi:hypothetical protein
MRTAAAVIDVDPVFVQSGGYARASYASAVAVRHGCRGSQAT